MRIIVDANIIFSALIKSDSTIKLLLDERISPFTPEFIFEELLTHRSEILEKTVRSRQEYDSLLRQVLACIEVIAESELLDEVLVAERLISDPHDVMYFAAALHLQCPIWSNDKLLKKQNLVKVYTTDELYELLS